RRERNRGARRDVVVVVEVILPVVPDTHHDRHVGPDADLVLRETAEHFFEEDDVTVPRLLNERIRAAGDVISEAREVKRARRVRVVVEPAAAQVGNLEAHLRGMPARGPVHDVGELEVMFRAGAISLRATAREGVEDDDPWSGAVALPRLVLVAD